MTTHTRTQERWCSSVIMLVCDMNAPGFPCSPVHPRAPHDRNRPMFTVAIDRSEITLYTTSGATESQYLQQNLKHSKGTSSITAFRVPCPHFRAGPVQSAAEHCPRLPQVGSTCNPIGMSFTGLSDLLCTCMGTCARNPCET
jgi:hypothetical protein